VSDGDPERSYPADPENREREIIYEAVQRAVTECEVDGGLVSGFFCIIEVKRPGEGPTARPYLMYRTGDINREGLTSWVGLGFLHSALLSVEDQHHGGFRDAHLDDDDDEDGGQE
jgi:hypothetical protein